MDLTAYLRSMHVCVIGSTVSGCNCETAERVSGLDNGINRLCR